MIKTGMIKTVTKTPLIVLVLAGSVATWWFSQLTPTNAPLTVGLPAKALTAKPGSLTDVPTLPSPIFARSAASHSWSTDGKADTNPLTSHQMFNQLLRDYGSTDTDQEDKTLIEKSLRELNSSALGRSFIVDTFFSVDEPELAVSMYYLILDADLKEVALLEELIRRDRTESAPRSRARIIDLIADLMTQGETPYSSEIDGYLEAMSADPDPHVRSAAKSQLAWYLAKYQPDNTTVIRAYLLDESTSVRSEMYNLIAARIADQATGERAELVLTLQSLLHADYLGIAAEEQAQIAGLIQSLGGNNQ